MHDTAQVLLLKEEPLEDKANVFSDMAHHFIGQMRLRQTCNDMLEGIDLQDLAAGALNTPIRLKCEHFCSEISFSIENRDSSDMNRNRKVNPDLHAQFQKELGKRFNRQLAQRPSVELHFLFLNICAYSGGRGVARIWNTYKDKSIWGKYATRNFDMTFDKAAFVEQHDTAERFHESNVRMMVREFMAKNRLYPPLAEGFQAALENDPELCRRVMMEEAQAHFNRWRK